ncbi:hypothetical protein [Profundibacterium mesophilum]|uniref:SARP family transcriptional regulator n=1 Tax=Profundibacterium mesophilum KAUST100406-0324 TaxID=1037889 RepID=A0A921NQC6_9RHOB|nr:hypothetical protein [Profundibacterium mesophilum]KAF0676252.1 hypothetical protein PMES_01409 [Profundibacterium mesophilum KAUST100406-0324]
MLTLYGIGNFELLDRDGQGRAPRGMKARGLIVLLATAPGHSRTRAWLQSRLWSDRAPRQAAASLRQALSDIRRELGPARAALRADRESVALDPRLLSLRLEPPPGRSTGLQDREAFEDIDIPDPVFEDTIRDIRARIAAMPAETAERPDRRGLMERPEPAPHGRDAPPWAIAPGRARPGASPSRSHVARVPATRAPLPRPLLLVTERAGSDPHSIAALWTLREVVLTALREHGAIDIVSGGSLDDVAGRGGAAGILTLNLRAILDNSEICLRADIEELRGHKMVWSGQTLLAPEDGHDRAAPPLDILARRIIEELLGGFGAAAGATAQEIAAVLSHRAVTAFFRLDREEMRHADRLLSRGFELEPCGQYLALRALLRNLASFQHRSTDFLHDRITANRLLHQALRHSPANSLVQAVASQLEYIDGLHGALPERLARSSVETDPSNPFCWAFLSNALAPTHSQEGYAAAVRAVSIARAAPHRYFFEHFACMSAAAIGAYGTARQHAGMALRIKPDFVSTRRYEVALALHSGDEGGAAMAIAALRREEPDFTPSLLRDPSYPVVTMQKLPLIDAIG